MAIRIPQNQIIYKYTAGKEYMYKNTYKEYQGYYYEINNKLFVGKEFSVTSRELVKIRPKEIETLDANPEVKRYIGLTKNKKSLPTLENIEPAPLEDTLAGIPSNDSDYTAYFYKKILDDKTILIKEISRDTFNILKNNPIYQIIAVKVNLGDAGMTNEEAERAEKEMPGFYDWFFYQRPGAPEIK
jgi:hypothetical protein